MYCNLSENRHGHHSGVDIMIYYLYSQQCLKTSVKIQALMCYPLYKQIRRDTSKKTFAQFVDIVKKKKPQKILGCGKNGMEQENNTEDFTMPLHKPMVHTVP